MSKREKGPETGSTGTGGSGNGKQPSTGGRSARATSKGGKTGGRAQNRETQGTGDPGRPDGEPDQVQAGTIPEPADISAGGTGAAGGAGAVDPSTQTGGAIERGSTGTTGGDSGQNPQSANDPGKTGHASGAADTESATEAEAGAVAGVKAAGGARGSGRARRPQADQSANDPGKTGHASGAADTESATETEAGAVAGGQVAGGAREGGGTHDPQSANEPDQGRTPTGGSDAQSATDTENAGLAGVVEQGTRRLMEILPYAKNPRINDKAAARVMESIRIHGQVKPLVLSAAGHPFERETLCCGHATLKALKGHGGIDRARVVVKRFASEAEFVDYNIRDNKAAEFAEWDDKALVELQDAHGIDLLAMGFEMKDKGRHGDTDERPEVEFTEEMMLEHNYIVLYFDNPMDWNVAQDKFKLKKVKDLIPRKGQPVGIGRVLRGAEWLDKIQS